MEHWTSLRVVNGMTRYPPSGTWSERPTPRFDQPRELYEYDNWAIPERSDFRRGFEVLPPQFKTEAPPGYGATPCPQLKTETAPGYGATVSAALQDAYRRDHDRSETGTQRPRVYMMRACARLPPARELL